LKAQVDRAHEAARGSLAVQDLTGAQALLARIGHTHAKAALLLGQVITSYITCGKVEQDGTEDHPMVRTDTLSD
jgi:uncharacterized membrane protein YdcZ (DUF606 family)